MSKNLRQKVAIYPGSFNPFHVGHMDVLRKGLKLFDEITILIAMNPNKSSNINPEFTYRQRLIVEQLSVFPGIKLNRNVIIDVTPDPLFRYCLRHKIHHIIKGLRNSTDFEYERTQAIINDRLTCNLTPEKDLDTVFVLSDPIFSDKASSTIRELAKVLNEDDFCSYVQVYFNEMSKESLLEMYDKYRT